MDTEQPKKVLHKGIAAVGGAAAGGATASAILFFMLQGLTGRVDRMEAKLGKVSEDVVALRVKQFGAKAEPPKPPTAIATPHPFHSAQLAEPQIVPVPALKGPKK